MINIDEMKDFLGCDDTFVFSLLKTFIKESADGLSKLKSATASGDWPMVRAMPHKMLSSVRILNLSEMVTVLTEMEIIAESQKGVEQIPEKLFLYESLWKEIIAEINELPIKDIKV